MKVKAAIARGAQEPFSIETLDLEPPRDGEVLVRVVAALPDDADELFSHEADTEAPLRESEVTQAGGNAGETDSRVIAKTTENGTKLELEIIGAFCFGSHRQFRIAYETEDKRYELYEVKLSQCTEFTATGLGMLLCMQEYTEFTPEDLVLTGMTPEIKHMVEISGITQ